MAQEQEKISREKKKALLKRLKEHIKPKMKLVYLAAFLSWVQFLMQIISFYLIAQGFVTYYEGEQEISSVSQVSLNEQVLYVSGQSTLLNQSIYENLRMAGDWTKEDILAWADEHGVLQFVKNLPDGLDTLVEASDFSAGEGQRLELMRALLKNADCYIFDEPTSNLDSLNEAHFIQLVKAHCQGMVFLISHRNSTMACADTIFRLENGNLHSQSF
ncbi:TPA: ATP-binding cassette domain-containing protein [Streptococcus suis]|nr:ATP-binding cassette domain-containing protein [Streptococcus suis]